MWRINPKTAWVPASLAPIVVMGPLICGTLAALIEFPLGDDARAQTSSSTPNGAGNDALDLNDKQVAAIKIESLGTRSFAIESHAVGSVDFNEDLSVQVFPHYQGKIAAAFFSLGDEVKKGQPLYTIYSPDLIAAEGTLIEAAATLELTDAALARAKTLYDQHGIAQKELEQATSDQGNAEGALKAARNAVVAFGKSLAEADRIIATRKIDPLLVVPSPIDGRVTARNAQPGLFVQPGVSPAPYNIADLAVLWLQANVPENDSPKIHVGQAIKVYFKAFPGRIFQGKIVRIGTAVDPNVHTVLARSEISDPLHELRPGMIASFSVETAAPVASVAIPINGVVREGDGTLTAWVTTDRRHFVRRVIEIGLLQGGYRQISDGLKAGELAVTDGAILLDNMAAGVSAAD